jgi:hypothetical protein
MTWGTVELEPEIRDWLEALPTALFARAAFYVDLLAEQGPLLGEPHCRQLDGKLRELRFHLDNQAMRITYWIAPRRRIILLTVFRKTSQEIDGHELLPGAPGAWCIAEGHTVDPEEAGYG